MKNNVRPKRLPPPEQVYVLFKNNGQVFSMWENKQDAIDDAMGPAFRPTFTVRTYVLAAGRGFVAKGG